MSAPEYNIEKRPAFSTRSISIKSDPPLLSGEYTLVEPCDARDEFLINILAKRFLQVASVVKTSPKNAMKKLSEAIILNRLVIDFRERLSNAMMSAVAGDNYQVYVWKSNKGAPIYIIPLDFGLYALAFETEDGNKYFVVIDPKLIALGNA